ncbi:MULTISPECIES: hypothetical protein [Erysipelotrichaceae]|uniref:hypothetical protein n=1 Tax=Erysipelotrichaceae TaxID=128827 RepID=UPI00259AFC4D|nr:MULTISPECIES: hypothetical protein [Erysipelotrichaceae]
MAQSEARMPCSADSISQLQAKRSQKFYQLSRQRIDRLADDLIPDSVQVQLSLGTYMDQLVLFINKVTLIATEVADEPLTQVCREAVSLIDDLKYLTGKQQQKMLEMLQRSDNLITNLRSEDEEE